MTPRFRHPTDDELRLWAEIARTATPLPGKRLPAPEGPGSTPQSAGAASEQELGRPQRPTVPRPPRLGSAGLGRREARALARGRAVPDGSIDLHGMSQAEAHAALVRFLRSAHGTGRSLVVVVTGKGRPSGLATSVIERGVLRRMVPHWLALPDLSHIVVGFEEAGPRQGGAGALYVRLRRPRA